MIYEDLLQKKTKLSVIGLGYVGLPIALEFAKNISVIGFDINSKRIAMMQNSIDPSEELPKEAFENTDIVFTDKPENLKQASFHIVAVPTPIDKYNQPDLTPLLAATRTVGSILKKGDYVVFESTVYPGCTEEDCIPILESLSGLKFNKDFMVGFSPERINPGDKEHTIRTVKKIVSGCCPEALDNIANTYELVVKAGVHRASSIKVAEAAKIIENTQRDINIALMNELSKIFNLMGINTYDVLEAAGTKWNFLNFKPGLVGGHCIGVDPYYLVHKAQEYRYHPQIINAGRRINDSMGYYIVELLVKKFIETSNTVVGSKVLVMGATFKEDVSDIRNSRVADIVDALKSYNIHVDIVDPYADSDALQKEYGFGLIKEPKEKYNGIIVAVNHKPYVNLTESDFATMLQPNGVIFDVKGIYRNKISNISYCCL